MQRLHRHNAFTLVEVLVVLGIIICLMGMILPMISHMREDAKRVQCVNKVRQLTVAWQAYASEYERHPPGGWIDSRFQGKLGLEQGLLWPYMKDYAAYRCADDPITSDTSPNCSSFQLNGALPRKLDDLGTASATFVFIEGCDIGVPKKGSLKLSAGFATPIYPQNVFKSGGYPGANHKAASMADVGTPISFADGHAIFWKYSDPRTANILETLLVPGFSGPGGSVAPNSPDVYQLEAWSGGQVPPGVSQ
ncbi:MAG TPA: DUF1559 domain-containing protein [Tepidisphaeraceae bacterium]